METVTVVIPTIPPRGVMLSRAIRSVAAQTHQAYAVSVANDICGDGAPVTRHRALLAAGSSKWVAFLDDDDEFLPNHLVALLNWAAETGADYVYSYYEIFSHGRRWGEADPVLGLFGQEFDPQHPQQTTITTLVRRELAQSVGFALDGEDAGRLVRGERVGEDYKFTLGCLAAGAKISHLPERTWLWHHDSGNTSGRPWNRPNDWHAL